MKKLTVTIGIPALNEAANIKNILNSLLAQKQTNFNLSKILVISDGSTDNTVKFANEIKSPKIKVIAFKKREGLTCRLNYLFAHSKSDVVVKIDADVIPSDNNLISEMVKPFVNNKTVGYVSGKIVSLPGRTFLEKAVIISRLTFGGIKNEFKDGDSVYSCAGAIFALSKNLAKITKFPKNIWADIGYIYFWCLKNHFTFKSNKKAIVLIKTVDNFNDYRKQFSRYTSEQSPLKPIFGSIVESEYRIPKVIIYKNKLINLLRHPLECVFIFTINFYILHLSKGSGLNASAKWQMAGSSKKGISNA